MTHKNIIIDTGPLVAFFNKRDTHHEWTKIQLATVTPPVFTCEAVISEACFLLRNLTGAKEAVLECLHRNLIEVSFTLKNEVTAIKKLLGRYATVPMSFADACLVRMAEQYDHSEIITFDHDFHVYRQHGRQVIPTRMPASIL